MRLNLRNENFALKGVVFTIALILAIQIEAISSKSLKKPRLRHSVKDRELMQFSSPLMNTFSNYIQRENSDPSKPTKNKEIKSMEEGIQKAKEIGMNQFFEKKEKKKSLSKKKTEKFAKDIELHFSNDENYRAPVKAISLMGGEVAQQLSNGTGKENNVVLLEQADQVNRKLDSKSSKNKNSKSKSKKSRESQNPSEESVESEDLESPKSEQIKNESKKLKKEEIELKNEETTLKKEAKDLKGQEKIVEKAEKELKNEEKQMNNIKAIELQREEQFNVDIQNKNAYLVQENDLFQQHQQDVQKRLKELQGKIKNMTKLQKDFQTKFDNIQAEKAELENEKKNLGKERSEIGHEKKISDEIVQTAKNQQQNMNVERKDLQNRVQELKSMRKDLNDLKTAYSISFHKVVVHENLLKTREKMLQVAEEEVSKQKIDLAHKLIDFKREYAILKSRESAVDARENNVLVREDQYFKTSKKRKLKVDGQTTEGNALDNTNPIEGEIYYFYLHLLIIRKPNQEA